MKNDDSLRKKNKSYAENINHSQKSFGAFLCYFNICHKIKSFNLT